MIRSAIVELPYTAPPLSMNDQPRSRQGAVGKSAQVAKVRADMRTLAAASKLPTRLPYCTVRLHYVPRDNRRRDTDNLIATLKPLCDGLIDFGLTKDDNPQFMAKLEPRIHAGNPAAKVRMWLEIVWPENHLTATLLAYRMAGNGILKPPPLQENTP